MPIRRDDKLVIRFGEQMVMIQVGVDAFAAFSDRREVAVKDIIGYNLTSCEGGVVVYTIGRRRRAIKRGRLNNMPERSV